MKLIKDLGTFRNNNKSHSEKRGLFFCIGCSQVVEKRMDVGKIAKSCGCLQRIDTKTKHGESGTTLYRKWSNMKRRCYDKKYDSYLNYGGRGISVCDAWFEFLSFMTWAKKNGYKNNLSLERVNNDGNYCPNNCTFITMAEQQRNKQNTKLDVAKVKMIRRLWVEGNLTQKQIGALYNISDKYANKVIKNRVWVNV